MLCDQLDNSNFGDTAQGRRLLAGSVSTSNQGAQFFRAKGAKLFADHGRQEQRAANVERSWRAKDQGGRDRQIESAR
eukprot:2648587-Pleurochrysis_carterae.AAC.2